MAPSELTCPLCGSNAFKPYRGRANAVCAGCGAKERSRFLGLVLNKLAPPPTGKRIYHLAPERAIADILVRSYGDLYTPADFVPELYSWSEIKVEKIDLSKVPEQFKAGEIGAFVHSHVLEHIPGSIERVIRTMNEAIAPNGFHVFQAPIERGWYREDMDPDLPAEERIRIFKQDDHLRMFGAMDFEDRILTLFDGFDRIDLAKHFTRSDLARAGVPVNSLEGLTGHSVFLFVKR